MAPSGDRSGLGVAQRRRRRFRAPARCRSGDRRSKPSPRFTRGGVLPSAKKTDGSELCSLPAFSGECVKGGILPFHKKVTTNRNSPKRAEGAQGSFDSGAKRRAVPGRGLNSNRNYDRKLFQIKAPSGDRSGLGVAQRRRRRFRAPARCRSGDRRSTAPAAVPAEGGVVLPTRGGVLAKREKNNGSELSFAARVFGGMCERGDSPLSQKGNDKSELAEARRRRAREFRFRREAPGGPRTGPQLQPELRPKAIPDQGPVRGPLRTWRGAASSAQVSRSRAMPVWRPALHCSGTPSGPGAEGGVVLPTRHLVWAAVSQARKKQWQRTLFAARVFGGMCERGDSPLSQKGNDKSELAEARRRRAREFRFAARSAGRSPDGASTPTGTTTESYSRSRPRPGTAPDLAWRSVVGAGFALPRDAGLETGAPLLRHAVRARRCRAEAGVVLPTRHRV